MVGWIQDQLSVLLQRNYKMENKTLHTFSYIPPNDFEDFTPKHLMADERPLIKSTVEYVGEY